MRIFQIHKLSLDHSKRGESTTPSAKSAFLQTHVIRTGPLFAKSPILLTNGRRIVPISPELPVLLTNSKPMARTWQMATNHKHPLRLMTKSGAVCRGEEHFPSSSATSPAPVTPFAHQNPTILPTHPHSSHQRIIYDQRDYGNTPKCAIFVEIRTICTL